MKPREPKSVFQDWVPFLALMQQGVLLANVRGPDGIRKDHPVKVIYRWFRRSFLLCAFDGLPFDTPGGEKPIRGGSFTGPTLLAPIYATDERDPNRWGSLDWYAKEYLRSVDELPHHAQLHMCHAAEILGYKHPDTRVREWWRLFYLAIVNDAHLRPEPEEVMDRRLGDSERDWRAAEEVTAK